MKNITVSLDDDSYRRARVKAAERDTSVSAMVREFLESVGSTETAAERFERLKRKEHELRKRVVNFSAGDNLPRDQLYDRKL